MSPTAYTVLVTGSRQASEPLGTLVHRELDALFIRVRETVSALIIRHGACPTGVDQYAAEWARLHRDCSVTEDRHPADWTGPCHAECTHGPRLQSSSGRSRCPAAGPRRNKAMVDLGADEVLAFPVGKSPGTRSTMKLAKAAGLPIHVPAELRGAA